MQIRLTLAACLLTGCISNWTGDGFDHRFATRPHWPDCDGDGWGDPLVQPECLNPIDVPPPEGCEWAPNGFDCDDAYLQSGSRVGSACPADFGPFLGLTQPMDTANYQVVPINDREFLVLRDHPVTSAVAGLMCAEWTGELLPLGSDGLPVEPVGIQSAWYGERDGQSPVGEPDVVLGLPESAAQIAPLAAHITQVWGLDSWRAWVDVWFDVETGQWTYSGAANPLALAFCPDQLALDLNGNGVVDPHDIFQGLIDQSPSAQHLDEVHADARLVLRIEGDAIPCLEAPTAACPLGDCIPEANLLCERPLQVVGERELFSLADMECAQLGLD